MPGTLTRAETPDELRERLLKRSEQLARDLPHLERQYRQRLVSDEGVVHDYLNGSVGLHVHLGLSGSGVAPLADYELVFTRRGDGHVPGDVIAAAADEDFPVSDLPQGEINGPDQSVTVETGELMEPPQFLCPSWVRLYRLDDPETVRREFLYPVVLLERPRVVEYWKLNPIGFTGTVNKRDLISGVIKCSAEIGNDIAAAARPEDAQRTRSGSLRIVSVISPPELSG